MAQTNNNKCLIFSRVSTADQEVTGYSLPAQTKFLKFYAENSKLKIIKVYKISESGGQKYNRRIFKEMIDYAKKNNINNIIVEKVDRITRNMRDAVLLDDWMSKDENRRIHSVKDSLVLHKNARSQEKLNWNIKVVIAQNYIDNLSEEVKKGQMEKITQGWLPTKPPIGYKTVGEKGHKTHVIDDDKAPLVKKMFKMYASGNISLTRLTEKMYRLGLRTRGGNKIGVSRIHEIIQDPFYFGKIRWNRQIYQGKQEPLITEELFEQVQKVRMRKDVPKYSKHQYLFRKFFKCAGCGKTITWEKQKKQIYGHCNYASGCKQRTFVRETEVNKQVKQLFKNLEVKNKRLAEWIKKSLKESHLEEIEYRTNAKKELENRLQSVEQRLEKLYDDKLDEKITVDFYDKKFAAYSAEQKEIASSLKKLSNENLRYYEVGINIYELSQRAEELYNQAEPERKKRLLSLVFDELILDKEKVVHKYSKPFEILSEAVKATNSLKTNRSKIEKIKESGIKILEPCVLRLDKRKTEDFASVHLGWLRTLNEIRTFFKENPEQE